MSEFAFGVYVHWPFCAAKCPYCDFNSHVRASIPETEWCQGLERELDFAALELIPANAAVTSIFFGGGTPSLMSVSSIGSVLERISRRWSVSSDVEVTLEANPSSADVQRFRGYRAAGVNRLSIGVQSLNNDALRFLGRIHDSAEARHAVAIAIRSFERVSIDLIYGRPGQSVSSWRAELGDALSLGTEHLSLYQLTIEDGTQFSTKVRMGALVPLADEPAADLFEETQSIMESAGLPAYEISNHARPGRECRHNLLYWRYGNYLGVGPGSHGRITRDDKYLSTTTERNPERWLAQVAALGHGFQTFVPITPEEGAREHLLMSLRLREGMDRHEYHARWKRELNRDCVRMLVEQGVLEDDGIWVRASARGRLVLNAVTTALANAN